MSDALTDIARDEELGRLARLISKKEKEFLSSPDREKAAELRGLWAQYYRSPRGYWGSPNKRRAAERVVLYTDYLAGKDVDFTAVLAERNSDEGTFFFRVGNGFIVNSGDLEEYILWKIWKTCGGPVSFSNFKVKITVEEVGRMTCATCPDFGLSCSSTCNNRVEEEYRLRRERAEAGEVLLSRGFCGLE
ncbi:MAG: hypothetical protein ACPLSY_03540 [Moorellaceae bacterium]